MKNADHQFMQEAIELARHAASLGEVPIAALVVKDGEVIGRAHNRREIDHDPTAHAEVLAIRQAAQHIGDWRLEGCTVYVTVEPCPMCAGALWLARIQRCVYGCKEPKAGFLGSLADLNQFSQLNHHYEVNGEFMAEECAHVLRTFFRRIRLRNKKTG